MKPVRVIAVVLSGFFLSTAWLDLPGYFSLFGFVPLLYLDNHFTKRKDEYVPITFWYYAFVSMFAWNFMSLWWLTKVSVFGATFAIISNAFLMSLIWLLVHVVRRSKGNTVANLILIFGWLSFEFLHFRWELSMPWLTLGNSLANHIKLIQWYELTGVLGGSLWIILLNLAIWNVLQKMINKEKLFRVSFLILGIAFVAPVVFSLYIYHNLSLGHEKLNVVITQPNIDPYQDKFDGMSRDEQYECLLSVCKPLGGDSIDFFIGPETALHDVWLNEDSSSYAVERVQNFMIDYPESAFVVGALSYFRYNRDDKLSDTYRLAADGTYKYDAFNTALMIDSTGVVNSYHKAKLVSGVEKMPYHKYLRYLKNLSIDLGGTTGSLGTHNNPVVFEHKSIKVGVPICFETVYGEYLSQFVKDGAEVLFSITNDGWWNNSPGYKQHLAFTKVLAIQLRRSIARSGNTGVSAIINEKGTITSQTQWWKNTALAGEVNRNTTITFYAEHGDYLGRMAMFLFLLMNLSMGISRLKSKKEPHYPVV